MIAGLLNPQIYGSRNLPDPVRESRSDFSVLRLISPADLNIKRRRKTKIQSLANDIRGQKIKCRAGKLAVNPLSQPPHIFFSRPVSMLQRYQNIRVAGPD